MRVWIDCEPSWLRNDEEYILEEDMNGLFPMYCLLADKGPPGAGAGGGLFERRFSSGILDPPAAADAAAGAEVGW